MKGRKKRRKRIQQFQVGFCERFRDEKLFNRGSKLPVSRRIKKWKKLKFSVNLAQSKQREIEGLAKNKMSIPVLPLLK